MRWNNWLSRLVQSCPFSRLVLLPTASMGLSNAFFLRSQGACYSSSNSTWQGDLCPTKDGLNWGGRGGGSYVPCPTLWSLHHSPPAQAPLLACKGKRGSDGSRPPYAGPLAGLWRGERNEAGRSPLKHTPKVLFMPMLYLTGNANS